MPKSLLVPLFMLLSSCLMALAWLGHLRYRDSIGFWTALGASWLLVLPEYVLNVAATRFGYGTYSGAQMASFHLAFGVVASLPTQEAQRQFHFDERIGAPSHLSPSPPRSKAPTRRRTA